MVDLPARNESLHGEETTDVQIIASRLDLHHQPILTEVDLIEIHIGHVLEIWNVVLTDKEHRDQDLMSTLTFLVTTRKVVLQEEILALETREMIDEDETIGRIGDMIEQAIDLTTIIIPAMAVQEVAVRFETVSEIALGRGNR